MHIYFFSSLVFGKKLKITVYLKDDENKGLKKLEEKKTLNLKIYGNKQLSSDVVKLISKSFFSLSFLYFMLATFYCLSFLTN